MSKGQGHLEMSYWVTTLILMWWLICNISVKTTPPDLIPEVGLKQKSITAGNFGRVTSHLGT